MCEWLHYLYECFYLYNKKNGWADGDFISRKWQFMQTVEYDWLQSLDKMEHWFYEKH